MKKPVYCFVFLCLPLLLHAQQTWDAGGGIGFSYYFGDLDIFPTKLGKVNPGVMLHARRNVGNYAAFRGNISYSTLSGDDRQHLEPEWKRKRGYSFYTPLVEAAVQGEIYPFGLFRKFRGDSLGGYAFDKTRQLKIRANGDTMVLPAQHQAIMPYLLAGIGGAYINPKVNWNKQNSAAINVDKLADYSPYQLIIPLGGGLRFVLNERTTLGIEVGWRATFTDYLDGVSAAGNLQKDDWYFSGMLLVSRSFGKSDRDKDGVADSEDRCPNLPGTKPSYGCPDDDRDGTINDRDQCPGQPGPRSLLGCPDADKDGIADREDKCPDLAGKPQFNGCPDTDNDGVPDPEDACPKEAGSVSSRGCPEFTTLLGAGIPQKAIYFDSQKSNWYESSNATLEEVLGILQNDTALFARIEGYTDNTSDEGANQSLSEQRAKKCYDFLIARGIAPKMLSHNGFSEKRPIASNATPEGRQLNRRVEVYFYR